MSSLLQPTSFNHGLGLHSSSSQGIQQNINLDCKQNSFCICGTQAIFIYYWMNSGNIHVLCEQHSCVIHKY